MFGHDWKLYLKFNRQAKPQIWGINESHTFHMKCVAWFVLKHFFKQKKNAHQETIRKINTQHWMTTMNDLKERENFFKRNQREMFLTLSSLCATDTKASVFRFISKRCYIGYYKIHRNSLYTLNIGTKAGHKQRSPNAEEKRRRRKSEIEWNKTSNKSVSD